MSKFRRFTKHEVERIVEMHLNTNPSKKRFSFNKGTLFYESTEGSGVVIKVENGSSFPFVKKPLNDYTVECLTTKRAFPLLSLYSDPSLVDILQGEVRRYWGCNATF